MRKSLIAVGFAIAAMTAPASATTFFLDVNPHGAVDIFGNTSTSKGAFRDDFVFSIPAGSISSFVSAIALSTSRDVAIWRAFLDGTRFTKISSGVVDLWTLPDTDVTAGWHEITVLGNWGKKGGAYTGGLSFTAAAVPEPASWAMMISGFALVGAAMRRRRVKTNVSYA